MYVQEGAFTMLVVETRKAGKRGSHTGKAVSENILLKPF